MTIIKAVIFDMDGVLIDAKDWHYEALNMALRTFGLEISRHDHLTTYDGLSTKHKLEMLSQIYHLPKSLHGFINDLKQSFTMDMVQQLCKPTFIHQYALSHLKLDGYKLAVASNSVRDSVDTMMRKANLMQYLEFYLSNQDVSKSKPDPEIYDTAIKKLGLFPEECVVVEDNENGIKAARGANANVLVVEDVTDVTYQRIKQFIAEVEK
jgi:beta-phosphoglucomutase-like phosphatase (HAD superfamily)